MSNQVTAWLNGLEFTLREYLEVAKNVVREKLEWKVWLDSDQGYISLRLREKPSREDQISIELRPRDDSLFLKIYFPHKREHQFGSELVITLLGPERGTCTWTGEDLPSNKVLRNQPNSDPDEVEVPRYREWIPPSKRKKEPAADAKP